MAIIPLLSEEAANEDVKKVYEEIKNTFGIDFVPNLFKAMGNNPEILASTWAEYKAIMEPGELNAREKEIIAMAVSATNNCEYCIHAHQAALKGMGMTEQGILELVAVVGLYNHFNKFLDGLRVEPDLGV